jgi:hypothetical protein
MSLDAHTPWKLPAPQMRALIERMARRRLHLFPRALPVALVLGAVLSLPSLGVGFFGDDYLHLAILDGWPAPATPFNLFLFSSGDPVHMRPWTQHGPYPWWTLPELKLAFWRPLSSALMVLDHSLFGRAPVPYHVHSILWHLLTITAAACVLRRLPVAVGGLALLIFALDETHIFPVAWVANRNALVATAPALLGLGMHLRWRERGWRPGLPLSVLGLAVGLLGGETALGAFAYLGAYELLGGPGPWVKRARALLPALLLGLAYVAVYKALGYGAHGSGTYFDPVAEWRHYLPALATRIPTLLAGQFWVLPPELSVLAPSLRPHQVLVGCFTLLVVPLLFLAVRHTLSAEELRHTRWLVAGGLLSLLPVASTFPAGRLLLLPSLGASALLAVLCVGAWRALPTLPRWRRRTLGAVLGAMLGLQVLATSLWVLYPYALRAAGAAILESMARIEVEDERLPQQRVVSLVVPDPAVGLYPPIVRLAQGRPLPRSWLPLSLAPYDHVLHRTGAATFELSLKEGRFLSTELEQLFRGPAYAMRVGEQVSVEGFRATLLEVDGAWPLRIRFDFDMSLDDPDLVLLTLRQGTLQRLRPPPIGETVTLPWEQAVLGR